MNRIIIQARMGSSRLPGKIMMKVGEKSILDHVVGSLGKKFDTSAITIATSDSEGDDVIQEYCENRGLDIFRGSESNVASRFKAILELYPECTSFFRVCADGPLISTDTMLEALELIKRKSIITSMPNKGFPMGMNIELFAKDLFLKSYPSFSNPGHFEHVTRYFYERLSEYEVGQIETNIDGFNYDSVKFSVDTKEDLDFISEIFKEYPDINEKSANEKIICAMRYIDSQQSQS